MRTADRESIATAMGTVSGTIVSLWLGGLAFHFFPLPDDPDTWWAIPTMITILLVTLSLGIGTGVYVYNAILKR